MSECVCLACPYTTVRITKIIYSSAHWQKEMDVVNQYNALVRMYSLPLYIRKILWGTSTLDDHEKESQPYQLKPIS